MRVRALFLAVFASLTPFAKAQVRAGPTNSTMTYANTLPGAHYVGSKTCARCHWSIYAEYKKTAMGRSMALSNSPTNIPLPAAPVTVQSSKFHRYYQIFSEDHFLYQSVYALGPDAKEIFRDTQRISYVIGAGENGAGYIVEARNHLFEAPLSYYARSRSWDLSPGYETGDYGFHRPIPAGCIVCHSGRANLDRGRSDAYEDPAFEELAIGCENCHGPGSIHVTERMAGAPLKGSVDRSILNPADLPGWLADNVCMICHQFGDIRVLQPGKSYLDFRPGTPLDRTVGIFAIPFTPAAPPRSPLLQHYTLMTLSRCYQASGGRLSCVTCHDPHREPSGAQAVGFYRSRCLKCHTESSCKIPLAERRRQNPPDDCAGCHMPRQNLQGIAHSALTNHRIIAYPGEPFPAVTFHQTTSRLPDLVHVDAIPGKENAPVNPMVLFQAYGELMQTHSRYLPQYNKLLSEVIALEPDNPLVLSSEARRELLAGTPAAFASATRLMAKSVASGARPASDYDLYAKLLARSGNNEGAAAVLKQGIAVHPFSTELYESLAVVYSRSGDRAQALATLEEELSMFPEKASIRAIVLRLKSTSGRQ